MKASLREHFAMTMNDRYVRIFDTTLRDGQQCPGAGMSFDKNLQYALLAHELGVDVLEAGFPSASQLDFDIVHRIASDLGRTSGAPSIAALCQLRDEQIDRTIEALLPAVPQQKALLHTYLPVAPALMAASLGERAHRKSELVKNVYDFVRRAASSGCEVEFSPEGYSRVGQNFDFTTDLIRAAVEAGATVINCPDTIGGASIWEGDRYIVSMMQRHADTIARELPGRTIIWSIHCHNDFGLAVQNSLNAVFDGPARQIEGCINGIGERAGNAALEQCIVAIAEFGAARDPERPFITGIRCEKLQKVSDFVSTHMLPRQPHTPVVGDNAAKHSSGGHTNAILKDPLAYQPFDPRRIGKEVSFVFGPLSGGNHAKSIIEGRGYRCDDSEKSEIAQFIKERYADRRKGITDDELMRAYFQYRSPIEIDRFDYSKSANRSEVRFAGRFFGDSGEIIAAHEGRDSALAALKSAIDARFGPFAIESHRSESAGAGINAESISTVIIRDAAGRFFEGIGRDQDIEVSAMRALTAAVNNAYIEQRYRFTAAPGSETHGAAAHTDVSGALQ